MSQLRRRGRDVSPAQPPVQIAPPVVSMDPAHGNAAAVSEVGVAPDTDGGTSSFMPGSDVASTAPPQGPPAWSLDPDAPPAALPAPDVMASAPPPATQEDLVCGPPPEALVSVAPPAPGPAAPEELVSVAPPAPGPAASEELASVAPPPGPIQRIAPEPTNQALGPVAQEAKQEFIGPVQEPFIGPVQEPFIGPVQEPFIGPVQEPVPASAAAPGWLDWAASGVNDAWNWAAGGSSSTTDVAVTTAIPGTTPGGGGAVGPDQSVGPGLGQNALPTAPAVTPDVATKDYVYTPDGTDIHSVYRPSYTANGGLVGVKKLDGAKISKEKTTILDPADLTTPAAVTDPLPPGATLCGTKMVLARGTVVDLIDFDSTGTHAQVLSGGQTFWVDTGRVAFGTTSIKDRVVLDDAEQRGAGAGHIYVFEWGGLKHFVHDNTVDLYDLTYASPLSDDETMNDVLMTGKDSKASANTYNAKDNDASFGVSEAFDTGRVVFSVSGTLVDDGGTATKTPIKGLCVTLASRTVDTSAQVQVQLFDGTTGWVKASAVKGYSAAIRFSLEERADATYLITARDANHPEQHPEEHKILPEVAARLVLQQQENAKKLIENQTFTGNQKELMTKLDEYIQNPSLGSGYRDLAVPGDKMKDGTESLSGDLIKRLNNVYHFLQYANLITGTVSEIGSGIRSRATAHQLSTRWTIYSMLTTNEKKVRFSRMIVDIGGMDATSKDQWATAAEVKSLNDGLTKYDGGDVAGGMALIDPVITAIKGHTTEQKAQAAEGYPDGDSNRAPSLWASGVSNHCGGEAIDITFPFVINYFDPIIDAIVLRFGLVRAVKDSKGSPEHWHYERIGTNSGPDE